LSYETNVQTLDNLEYRTLQVLSEDARMPAARVAKALGVSRVTASRAISSLKRKGIAFVPSYYAGSVKGFVVIPRDAPLPKLAAKVEVYDLLDGDRMLTVETEDLGGLEEAMKSVGAKKAFYVATRKVGERVIKAELICDFCGGRIRGEPLLLKRGHRTYYACCNACLSGLRKRLGRTTEG